MESAVRRVYKVKWWRKGRVARFDFYTHPVESIRGVLGRFVRAIGERTGEVGMSKRESRRLCCGFVARNEDGRRPVERAFGCVRS